MDKCPKCGAEVSWTDDRPGLSRVGFKCLTFITSMGTAAESVECCKRQLAAVNERAGRLEAEREELTIAFHALEPAAHDGRLIALYGLPSHESYKTFARILGGA